MWYGHGKVMEFCRDNFVATLIRGWLAECCKRQWQGLGVHTDNWSFAFGMFFPPASAVEGIKSVPSVCLSVTTLPAKSLNVWTQNLVEGLTLTISRISSKVKVIGQRSRSLGWKTWFSDFQIGWPGQVHFVISDDIMWWTTDVMWRQGTTSWCHMTSSHLLTTFGQEYWQRGHVAGGHVNAQAFSLAIVVKMVPSLIPPQ